MARAIQIDDQKFPQSRTFTFSRPEELDLILRAVGFSGLTEGQCILTFPTSGSVTTFYEFVAEETKRPRAVRL